VVAKVTEPIRVAPINTRTLELALIGVTPLYQNRMSAKNARGILVPPPRMTKADKAANQKHDPRAEFRDAAQVLRSGETHLGIPATAFKGAMMTAALETQGGIQKTQVGRLCFVEDEYVPVYGVPFLSMSMVRMADINHTPDIRTRPVLPRWACTVRVTYVVPNLDETVVTNLLARAGTYIGVGDWRQEKGKGNFGRWRIVNAGDAEWEDIVAQGGRDAQMAAFETPMPYDPVTADLLSWYDEEMARRGKAKAA
jgi:hypothetical protein